MKIFLGVLLFVLVLASFTVVSASPENPQPVKLNLSHIKCVDGEVEIHFVLLHVPDIITPGNLIYNYGIIYPEKVSGEVWHYTTHLLDGYYDVTMAFVTVGDLIVNLHNPSEYKGEYYCNQTPTNTPTKEFTPTDTPTLTFTPTPTATFTASPTGTLTATPVITETVDPTLTPTRINTLPPPPQNTPNLLPITGADLKEGEYNLSWILMLVGVIIALIGLLKIIGSNEKED